MVDVSFDRARAAWWLLGAGVAAVVGLFAVSFVGTIVFGLFIYYASRPLNRQFQRVFPSRGLAAAASASRSCSWSSRSSSSTSSRTSSCGPTSRRATSILDS